MSDIVERLRERGNDEFTRDALLLRKAADEIENLRAYARHERSLGAEGPTIELTQTKQELADAKAEIERLTDWCTKLDAENERLKAQLKAMQAATKDLTLKVLEDLKQRALSGKL